MYEEILKIKAMEIKEEEDRNDNYINDNDFLSGLLGI